MAEWPFRIPGGGAIAAQSDLLGPEGINNGDMGSFLTTITNKTPADTLYLNGKEIPGICKFSISGGHKVTQTKPRVGDFAQVRDIGRELYKIRITIYIYTPEEYGLMGEFLQEFDSSTEQKALKVTITTSGVGTQKTTTKLEYLGYSADNPLLRNRSINRLYIEDITGPNVDYSGFVTYDFSCIEVRKPKETEPKKVSDKGAPKIGADKVAKDARGVTTAIPEKPSQDPNTTKPKAR